MSKASSGPEISVVIPTYRRESRLAFALEALAAQTLDADRYEVIVVRAPGALGPFARAPTGLDVRFLEGTAPSPANQRNHGWRAAAAPLVVFTDDDCRAATDWLERLLASADGPNTFLQGRTEPDPDEVHLQFPLARTITVRKPTGWYETCNMAYPRALLERLDGFDERFDAPECEDTELALRAKEAGALPAFIDDAVVWHAVLQRTFAGALREAGRREAMAMLLARHPQQREALFARFFVSEAHATLPLAALVGIAVRRRPLLAAAIGGAAVLRLQQRFRGWEPLTARTLLRVAAHAPTEIAVRCADIAATVRGAVRHRVLVV